MYFKILIILKLIDVPNVANIFSALNCNVLENNRWGETNLRFFQINHFDGNFFVELPVKPENKMV